jgi:hypothetical protein
MEPYLPVHVPLPIPSSPARLTLPVQSDERDHTPFPIVPETPRRDALSVPTDPRYAGLIIFIIPIETSLLNIKSSHSVLK